MATIKTPRELLRADNIVELRLNQMCDDLHMYLVQVEGHSDAEVHDMLADRYGYDVADIYSEWADSGD